MHVCAQLTFSGVHPTVGGSSHPNQDNPIDMLQANLI